MAVIAKKWFYWQMISSTKCLIILIDVYHMSKIKRDLSETTKGTKQK